MRFRRSKTGLALGSALGGRHAAREGSKHPPCEVHVKRPSTACVTRCGRACHSLWKGMSLAGPLCVEELSAPAPEKRRVCARVRQRYGLGSDRPRDEDGRVDCCAVFSQLDMARGARRRDRVGGSRAGSPDQFTRAPRVRREVKSAGDPGVIVRSVGPGVCCSVLRSVRRSELNF
jgi:hypothetical protein